METSLAEILFKVLFRDISFQDILENYKLNFEES